ncbi:hypothetical protein STSP_04070 [Streptomyces jeddahensis]|uniref:DUF35 domain-containing protein n=1 Tax=Streptomyces jeddahensis TaxID=1716141 RepID=A0A177HZK4_9ACTN|nr:hypothetical protein STSP_04070 [Streptomyces jeddahensis]
MQEETSTVADHQSALRYQRCRWCSSPQPRPATTCRICGSDRFRWEESAGHGRVVFTPTPPRKRLTMIQLDEGPLIDGLIRGGPQEKPWVGARVRLSSTQDQPGRPVFVLLPAEWSATPGVSR